MTDIDTIMARLRSTSLPLRVELLDGSALAEQARTRIAATRKSSAAAAVAALMLGVAGSAIPAATASAASAMPLGITTTLAPSTLLAN